MRSLFRLGVLLPLAGCVYILGDGGGDGHDAAGDPPRPDAPVPAPNTTGALALFPPGAAKGSRASVTLVDLGASDVDLREIVEVRLRGPVSLDVTPVGEPTARALALSLVVGTQGDAGLADLELVRADGLRFRIDDAFVVVDDPADIPGAPWSGDTGAIDTGGEDSAVETGAEDFPVDLDDTPTTPDTPINDSCVLDTACDSGRPPVVDTDGDSDTNGRTETASPIDTDIGGFAPTETGADTYGDTDVAPGRDTAPDSGLAPGPDTAR
jgi:hypothetical protein